MLNKTTMNPVLCHCLSNLYQCPQRASNSLFHDLPLYKLKPKDKPVWASSTDHRVA